MERTLVYSGLRWPHAKAHPDPVPLALTLADGTPMPVREFVKIVAPGSGNGTLWRPEVVDGSWRDLATLPLDSPLGCQTFVAKRGDPAGELPQARRPNIPAIAPDTVKRPSVVSSQWHGLQEALQGALVAWGPIDDVMGVSHFLPGRRSEANRFLLQHPAATTALTQISVVAVDDALVLQANTLAAFLITSAVLAIEGGQAMTKCRQCGSWFSIRRPAREPAYCSATCRTTFNNKRTAPAST